MAISPPDAAQLAQLINSIVTPHDAMQDAALLALALITVINSAVLYIHLRDHKKARERQGNRSGTV